MMPASWRRCVFMPTALVVLTSARSAGACATCFGDPNSSQTKAVNASILVLLGFILTVLATFASLFGYWMYRHAKYNPLALNGVSD